ncbi:MAG TPA: hypothetical protein VKF81_04275 [Blastocatellia bacterium]|nr:hypothetical protein [Blastocatellia bacterium]
MRTRTHLFILAIVLMTVSVSVATAQETPVVLSGAELTRVVPLGFYFEGQSAPTQMRNAAAARFGSKRYAIAGLVDTSGYSTEVRAKYQGFLITDSKVSVGGKELSAGAYGFGFSEDGKFNVFDVGGKELMSVNASKDTAMRRPRPLMMSIEGGALRLYAERSYVTIAAK